MVVVSVEFRRNEQSNSFAASVNESSPSNDNCLGEVVMADLVYNLVKGPVGWVGWRRLLNERSGV
jgi:hypothetical protein